MHLYWLNVCGLCPFTFKTTLLTDFCCDLPYWMSHLNSVSFEMFHFEDIIRLLFSWHLVTTEIRITKCLEYESCLILLSKYQYKWSCMFVRFWRKHKFANYRKQKLTENDSYLFHLDISNTMTYKEWNNKIYQNHNINSVILAQITSILNHMKSILSFKSPFFTLRMIFNSQVRYSWFYLWRYVIYPTVFKW